VAVFSDVWALTFIAYVFQTLFSFAIDPAEAKRSWFAGIAFPGLLSIGVMAIALATPFTGLARLASPAPGLWSGLAAHVILGWSTISTAAAWGIYRLDKAGGPKWLRNALLMLVGYGPLLCAIASAAIVAELRKTNLKWDKTIKTGKARIRPT
jgi:hypothetical protein